MDTRHAQLDEAQHNLLKHARKLVRARDIELWWRTRKLRVQYQTELKREEEMAKKVERLRMPTGKRIAGAYD